MKKQWTWLGGMALAGAIGAGVLTSEQPAAAQAQDEQVALVERGEYLAAVMGCADCHSPHGPDGKPIPGREWTGHPEGAPLAEWDPSLLERNILVTMSPTLTSFAGPFGVSVAGNLTPDIETGTGTLTADMLVESWRTGNHWKAPHRPVLPPMPMPAYARLSDIDIRAIHAFMMSLEPKRNVTPPSVVAPPPPPADAAG